MVKEFYEVKAWAKKQKINTPDNLTPSQQLDFFADQLPRSAQSINTFRQLFNQVRYGKKPFTKERKTQAKDLIKLIKTFQTVAKQLWFDLDKECRESKYDVRFFFKLDDS